jgi:flagellar protein FlgJ
MSGLSIATVDPSLLAGTPRATTADLARNRAKDAAEKFEAQVLSVMLQQMFAGLPTDGPFGGGEGEQMFRSVMTEVMGKEMAKTGGIGIADTVQREILKLQGLT